MAESNITRKSNYPPIKKIIIKKSGWGVGQETGRRRKGRGQKRLSHVVGVSPTSLLQPGVQWLLLESGF